MQFSTSSLAAMLVIGLASAQQATQTCSIVTNPSPPASMHCNARGAFGQGPGTVNVTNTQIVDTINDCIQLAKEFPAAMSFSYNYTSNVCTEYGATLVQQGWRGRRKLDTDTVYYNHNCFVEQCDSGIVSTATVNGQTTVMTSAAPATTTLPTCDKNQDACLSQFVRHSKVATSVCAGYTTQYFPPSGFGGVCTSVWGNQVSSVCSCLFGAQFTPVPTFTSNMTTSASATSSFTNSTSSFPSQTAFPTSANVTALPTGANTTSSSDFPSITLAPFPTSSNSTGGFFPTATGSSPISVGPISFNTTTTSSSSTTDSSSSSSSTSTTIDLPISGSSTSANTTIPATTTIILPLSTGFGTSGTGTGTSGFPQPTANGTAPALGKRFRYRLRN